MAEAAAKLKIMTVFGTRPEAIKMAPVVMEMAKHPDEIVPVAAASAITLPYLTAFFILRLRRYNLPHAPTDHLPRR